MFVKVDGKILENPLGGLCNELEFATLYLEVKKLIVIW